MPDGALRVRLAPRIYIVSILLQTPHHLFFFHLFKVLLELFALLGAFIREVCLGPGHTTYGTLELSGQVSLGGTLGKDLVAF